MLSQEKLKIETSFLQIYNLLIQLLDIYYIKIKSRKDFLKKKEELNFITNELRRLFSNIENELRNIKDKLSKRRATDIKIKNILNKKFLKEIIEFNEEELNEYKKVKHENEYLAHLLIWIKIFEERIKNIDQAIRLINKKTSKEELNSIIKNLNTFYSQILAIEKLFYDKGFFNGSPDIKIKKTHIK